MVVSSIRATDMAVAAAAGAVIHWKSTKLREDTEIQENLRIYSHLYMEL